jgi:3-hydroxybutyrate dehydrogenase
MLRAPFYLSKLTIPHMKKSSDGTGVIGNMASIHAHICTLNKPAYNITKFGLRALTQSIAAEGEGKIRSFSVSTGFVKTPLALRQIPAQGHAGYLQLLKKNVSSKMGNKLDISIREKQIRNS